ncbi:hypothetical protein EUTSA_v10015568mg, partial [Eutrema salsugineum]
GFLDDQFTELKKLQDKCSPDFVYLFFEDCEKLINNIARALKTKNVDFNLVGSSVHQLKGSSSRYVTMSPLISNICLLSSLGFSLSEALLLVSMKCWCQESQSSLYYLQGMLDSQNFECVRCLQQVDIEYKSLKARLQDLFDVILGLVEIIGPRHEALIFRECVRNITHRKLGEILDNI